MKKPENTENIDGGTTTRIDSNAPKVINSDNLVAFKTNFFLYGEYGSEFDASYTFEIKDDEAGRKVLTCETGGQTFSCEVDSSVMSGLQEIIKKYDLARSNGIEKFTAGLPPEYDYSEFYALYDSDETIRFSGNNAPESETSRAFVDYFARVFAEQGINDLLPPKETQEVVRFDFTVTDKDMCYIYGEIEIPTAELNLTLEEIATNGLEGVDVVTKIRKEPWDRSSNDLCDTFYADATSDYYEGLSELLKEIDINQYIGDQSSPGGFSYENTPEFYEFYIEYAYGNRISGFSEDSEAVEAFRPVANKIMEYLDTYFKDNTSAEILLSNGNWQPVERKKKDDNIRAQDILYKKYKHINATSAKAKANTKEFVVRRK